MFKVLTKSGRVLCAETLREVFAELESTGDEYASIGVHQEIAVTEARPMIVMPAT